MSYHEDLLEEARNRLNAYIMESEEQAVILFSWLGENRITGPD